MDVGGPLYHGVLCVCSGVFGKFFRGGGWVGEGGAEIPRIEEGDTICNGDTMLTYGMLNSQRCACV